MRDRRRPDSARTGWSESAAPFLRRGSLDGSALSVASCSRPEAAIAAAEVSSRAAALRRARRNPRAQCHRPARGRCRNRRTLPPCAGSARRACRCRPCRSRIAPTPGRATSRNRRGIPGGWSAAGTRRWPVSNRPSWAVDPSPRTSTRRVVRQCRMATSSSLAIPGLPRRVENDADVHHDVDEQRILRHEGAQVRALFAESQRHRAAGLNEHAVEGRVVGRAHASARRWK